MIDADGRAAAGCRRAPPPQANTSAPVSIFAKAMPQGRAIMTKADLERLKNRFDTIFNNVLCDMKPGWDDSIEGFNKAWDIARDIFKEEIGRAQS